MRVRVQFSKFGSSRFLGHLDVMRYFQKAFRRAELPLAFSEGYHPHPLLSFAQPLSLSYTSTGEYFDMELTEDVYPHIIRDRLNAVMCDEIKVKRVTWLPDYQPNVKKITGMALITGAAYLISLKEEPEGFEQILRDFYAESSYKIEKTTKTGTRECDLRAGVHGIALYRGGSIERLGDDEMFIISDDEILEAKSKANCFNSRAIVVFLDAGSEQNIPADLFLNGVYAYAGLDRIPEKTVHRIELLGDFDNNKKVPLWMIES